MQKLGYSKFPIFFQITAVSFLFFSKHTLIQLSNPEWDVAHPLERPCGVFMQQGAFKQILDWTARWGLCTKR